MQPSEFLKPSFAIFAAWLMAASYDIKGPPGKAMSFVGRGGADRGAGAAAGLRPGRARHRHLGADVFRRRGAGGAARRRRRRGDRRRLVRLPQLRARGPAHRRVPELRGRSADPDRLCDQRDPGGRLPRRRHRQRQREVDAAGRAYRLHHRGGGGGVRADPLRGGDGALPDHRGALAAAAGARARPVHPAGRDRARGAARACRR